MHNPIVTMQDMVAIQKHSRHESKVFLTLCFFCLAPLFRLPTVFQPWIAPTALIAGVGFALTCRHPFPTQAHRVSKWLLQASVVLLGFSIDISKVTEAGQSGLILSFVSISLVFGIGWVVQRLLKIRPITGLLVSAGTAICGGSAIAAVSSVVDAPEEDVSVAVGTVFLLNAVALLTFPVIGHLLNLSPRQFGTWSGIAIHDIASVVGAGSAYGPESLEIGTAVKLSRVLYLVPVTFIIALVYNRKSNGQRGKVQVPWFVGLFLLASVGRSWLPWVQSYGGEIKLLAAAGFALCLFLIGTALSKGKLQAVGIRPLALGLILWIGISLGSLLVVLHN